jgi:hypothetical protein
VRLNFLLLKKGLSLSSSSIEAFVGRACACTWSKVIAKITALFIDDALGLGLVALVVDAGIVKLAAFTGFRIPAAF